MRVSPFSRGPTRMTRGGGAAPSWLIDYDAIRSAGPMQQLPAGTTFTRASAAVGFDHLGRPFIGKSGEIVEWGKRRVENLLAVSQPTTTGTNGWTVNALAPELVSSDTTRYTEIATTAYHYVQRGSPTVWAAGATYFVSAVVTPETLRWLRLTLYMGPSGGNYQSTFDLQEKTPGTHTVGAVSRGIIELSNGKLQCWIKGLCLAGASGGSLEIAAQNADNGSQYLGTGLSVLSHGMQLERAYPGQTEPSEYVSNGVLSAPYHGWGADGVKYFNTDEAGDPIPAATMRGLIAMPSLTNVVRAASDLTQSNWTKAAAALTVAAAYDQVMGGLYTQARNLGATGVDSVSQGWTGLTAGGRYEPCLIMRAVDASGVVRLRATTGAGDWDIDLSAVAAGDLINRSHAAVTVNTEIAANGSGALTLEFDVESGALDFDISMITLVAGTAPAVTPIPNTSTSAAATRAGDVLAMPAANGAGTFIVATRAAEGGQNHSGYPRIIGTDGPSDESPLCRASGTALIFWDGSSDSTLGGGSHGDGVDVVVAAAFDEAAGNCFLASGATSQEYSRAVDFSFSKINLCHGGSSDSAYAGTLRAVRATAARLPNDTITREMERLA